MWPGKGYARLILEPARIFPSGIVASRTCNSAGTHSGLSGLNMTDRSYIVLGGTCTRVVEATSDAFV